jgi:hypothetical protein
MRERDRPLREPHSMDDSSARERKTSTTTLNPKEWLELTESDKVILRVLGITPDMSKPPLSPSLGEVM